MATLVLAAFSYSQALDLAHGTEEETTNHKQELFNTIIGFLGTKGVLAVGALLLAYLAYKAWARLTNPPNRFLLLPPNA